MQIKIHYCSMWNYKPKAAGLAAELKNDIGVKAELIAGSSGVFDVIVDGKTVYSKRKSGRFPEPGEVSELLKSGQA